MVLQMNHNLGVMEVVIKTYQAGKVDGMKKKPPKKTSKQKSFQNDCLRWALKTKMQVLSDVSKKKT